MYSYNRIHNDYDTNVVRVELNSSYRPHTAAAVVGRAASREPLKITSSSSAALNRGDTFTKHDRGGGNNSGGIVRSETFIVKHHDNSSDDHQPPEKEVTHERPDYGTYTRSKKKSVRSTHNGASEGKHEKDDKPNYATYTRKEKRGSSDQEKSLYINTDTYRKLDKKRASLLSQESENLNVETFTKQSKPKRVESFIKKIEKNLWRRKDPKEPSPAPSGHSTDKSDRESSGTTKRSKNIFNLIASGKKSTREVEIQCKMDEDSDYYSGIAVRKSSLSQSPDHQKKSSSTSIRPLKPSQRHENGSNQRLTSIIKPSTERTRTKTPQQRNDHPYFEHDSSASKKSSTPAPIRVEIDLRNAKNHSSSNKYVESSSRKPIGIASPQPQPRSVLKSGTGKSYESGAAKRHGDFSRNQPPPPSSRLQVEGNFRRDEGERMSFREYREQLRAKGDGRKTADTSDDDLRRSYQQSFFIPM